MKDAATTSALSALKNRAKFGSVKPRNAVAIYRVSSKKQLEGESIARQKTDVQEYCRRLGYSIVKEFELAETGSVTEKRENFDRAIQYCLMHHKKIAAVVIWKVDRFSRGGLHSFYNLKALLAAKGIDLKSATEQIDATPTGEMMEGQLALYARFENQMRVQRTIGAEKLMARDGYWCRPAPSGFQNVRKIVGHDASGKPMRRPVLEPSDPHQWELLQYGLRKQLTGMYKIHEVAEEMYKKGFVTRTGRPISPQTWLKICRSPIYGGWICEKWTDGEMVPARFQGAISREEWIELQSVLNGNTKKGVKLPRKKFNPDFPLRQFLCCPKCGRRATGAPSIGKMKKKYYYYGCTDRKGCKWGVRAETAHALFSNVLLALRPSDESLAIFREVVLEKWKDKYKHLSADTTESQKKVLTLRERKAKLVALMESAVEMPELLADLKKEHQEVSKELTFATMERQEKEIEEYDAETVLNHCTYFMANAHELWEKAPVEEKFRFQSLIFPDGIAFDVLEGKRTPKMSLVYEAIKSIQIPDDTLAAPRGVEPRLTD